MIAQCSQRLLLLGDDSPVSVLPPGDQLDLEPVGVLEIGRVVPFAAREGIPVGEHGPPPMLERLSGQRVDVLPGVHACTRGD